MNVIMLSQIEWVMFLNPFFTKVHNLISLNIFFASITTYMVSDDLDSDIINMVSLAATQSFTAYSLQKFCHETTVDL